jgi:IclR family KDG regulon transcriptional repressor
VKSADRVLLIFDLIATRGPLTFSEVAGALGLPASSTHNLLKTLVRREYLLLDPDNRRYHLGLRLWEVAQAYVKSDSLPRLAQPIMDRVVAQTGETVQLARLDGVENVYLAISESPQPMKLVSAVGKRLYAHATGLGKVMLAGLSEEEARRRLSPVQLPRFTPNTIVELDALLAALGLVRQRGYAIDNEEYVIGCRCIAMPVRDADGRVIAAMSVSIPTPRYSEELAARTHEALGTAVEELSRRLGFVGDRPERATGPRPVGGGA